jgi:hypothetical protein
MAELDDVDPRDVTVPSDEEAASDVPVADPDAEAQVDEDSPDTDTTNVLADDDPNKSW